MLPLLSAARYRSDKNSHSHKHTHTHVYTYTCTDSKQEIVPSFVSYHIARLSGAVTSVDSAELGSLVWILQMLDEDRKLWEGHKKGFGSESCSLNWVQTFASPRLKHADLNVTLLQTVHVFKHLEPVFIPLAYCVGGSVCLFYAENRRVIYGLKFLLGCVLISLILGWRTFVKQKN